MHYFTKINHYHQTFSLQSSFETFPLTNCVFAACIQTQFNVFVVISYQTWHQERVSNIIAKVALISIQKSQNIFRFQPLKNSTYQINKNVALLKSCLGGQCLFYFAFASSWSYGTLAIIQNMDAFPCPPFLR